MANIINFGAEKTGKLYIVNGQYTGNDTDNRFIEVVPKGEGTVEFVIGFFDVISNARAFFKTGRRSICVGDDFGSDAVGYKASGANTKYLCSEKGFFVGTGESFIQNGNHTNYHSVTVEYIAFITG